MGKKKRIHEEPCHPSKGKTAKLSGQREQRDFINRTGII